MFKLIIPIKYSNSPWKQHIFFNDNRNIRYGVEFLIKERNVFLDS